jgi:hypothetical protein
VEDVEDVWRIVFGSIGENGRVEDVEDLETNFDISGTAILKLWIFAFPIQVFSIQNRWISILENNTCGGL